jgi:glycosyltransferase involved in cell wall biosynthesis
VASAVDWSPTKAAWQRSMDVEILESCAAVTAVSDAVAAELRTAGLSQQTTIIRNGVPIPRPRPLREDIETIGVVAHLVARKGVDVLLRAVSVLPARRFSRLRIAGTGESVQALQSLAADCRCHAPSIGVGTYQPTNSSTQSTCSSFPRAPMRCLWSF